VKPQTVRGLPTALIIGGVVAAGVLGFLVLPANGATAKLVVAALVLVAEGLILLAVILPIVVWKAGRNAKPK
jgi:uncharacterized oligopeptide transporter (OPT) family protein